MTASPPASVREARPGDEDALVAMWLALWPDAATEEHRDEIRAILAGAPRNTLPVVLLVADVGPALVGFAEVGLRSYAEGCDPARPCGALEGLYVHPDARRRGVARALLEAAETWARRHGAIELASDTWIENQESVEVHLALGFEEAERIVCFRKPLDPGPASAPSFYGVALARLHHDHFGAVAEAAARELLGRLAAARLDSGTVVDLGAGTGILTRRALEAGFAVTSVDLSAAMLDLARDHARGATFLRASLWDVEIPSCIAVVAIGEAMSYAAEDPPPDLDRLERRLTAIHRALAPGGLLLFDVAGPGRAGPTGTRRAAWDKAGVLLYLHETEEDGRLTRVIDTFVPAGDLYRHCREVHHLVLYPPDTVHGALERAGFAVDRLDRYGSFAFPAGWTGFAAVRG